MNGNSNNERPEIYALQKKTGGWQVSRRDFLKAAGIGAVVVSAGFQRGLLRTASAEESLESLCKNTPAHQSTITHMTLSADGKYLLTGDRDRILKAWDFDNYTLLRTLKDGLRKNCTFAAGFFYDTSSVLEIEPDRITYYDLPLRAAQSAKSISFPESLRCDSYAVDNDGNIYGLRPDSVRMIPRKNSYLSDEAIYTFEEGKEGRSMRLLPLSGKLLVSMNDGSGLLDPDSGKMVPLAFNTENCALMPGDSAVLIYDGDGYRLASLIDGNLIWKQTNSALNDSKPKLIAAAVTPDGSMAVLMGGVSKRSLWQISMADGTLINKLDLGDFAMDNPAVIAMAGDGSKIAVAVGQSILFISLPDLKIIGCPVDLSEMKDDIEGIEVSGVDPVTGKTVTYTLPCGSPIPAGAVCVCNCVAGSVCTCDKVCTCDTGCSCVGHKTICTCDKVCTCDTGCSCVGHCNCNSHRTTYSSHYWHPN